MNLSDFDYSLPPGHIARYPVDIRSLSRLLCLDRQRGSICHRVFNQLPDCLNPGDLLVCNDTRVIPARLTGYKATDGRVEMLIERVLDGERIIAQVKGGGSLKPGSTLHISDAVFTMAGRHGDLFELICEGDIPVADIIDRFGSIPLPHYMGRPAEESDHLRYQTVFAQTKGSVAAPTAGLHFDDALFTALREKGIQTATVTLHIGAGTFAPVRTDDIREHVMHSEYVQVTAAVCDQIRTTKALGHRVIAVGTTAARSLESAAVSGALQPLSGDTSIFIYPGFTFRCIDALITNFHLPRSTLLMLVSAFAGRENILQAYREAIAEDYRFFSYGDAMLIV